MKSERDFLKNLEQKAKEQGKLVETELIPDWARGVGAWLAINPWRVLIPMSMVVYVIWRVIFGINVSDFVLGLFGGFR